MKLDVINRDNSQWYFSHVALENAEVESRRLASLSTPIHIDITPGCLSGLPPCCARGSMPPAVYLPGFQRNLFENAA